ncbi:adenylate/guanylate cyclase domain-containing protein [Bdellovibrio sp. HCB337]|uniref:adenylate/guanylate cyclase domain-containing protein n=1 Tax=Bdellovibrio sp. HCB337 TaxID=3394358 RepID=UPI0039A41B00
MQAQTVSEQQEYFVALFDLTNFGSFYKSSSPQSVLAVLQEFSELSVKAVEKFGGRVIKFSNDSGIAAFPSDKVDQGVKAMIHLKTEIDQWAQKKIPASRLAMNGHVGPAAIGALGNNSLEIVGEAVSMVYSMGKKQFVISPQTFRKLTPETRKEFHKYTPPIVYRLS